MAEIINSSLATQKDLVSLKKDRIIWLGSIIVIATSVLSYLIKS